MRYGPQDVYGTGGLMEKNAVMLKRNILALCHTKS